jgi:hypothetical protein
MAQQAALRSYLVDAAQAQGLALTKLAQTW